jgi:YdjC-like protein.
MTTEQTPHPVLLCADDYGLSPGVNEAIRDL